MATQTAVDTTWVIDPLHSEVQFKVKHLVISTVTGSFGKYEGQIVSHDDDDFDGASVSFSADIDSITTGQEQRDGHLKSADFFDAASHPKLTFVSTSMTKTGDDTYSLIGDLTIRGTTKSVTLNVEHGGQMQDFYGQTKAGFEISGTIKRKEFGLTWDGVTEAGGVVVSDDVKLALNIQVVKQG
ncbi:YceI family protein [Spirosoma sp. BT702]|uniref:YceI family protein n=1 Tax=Spirosoma profusum TaxID=2771354 RepID=A0A926XYA4_9BACT|nr:YceI family protein [Spirosoma profusum]MBD2703044.1 YceI family protein [Spirosoma profusum]